MGMYTELMLRAEISSSASDLENLMLRALFSDDAEADPQDLFEANPDAFDHVFFRAPRWLAVGSCSSYYHMPSAVNKVWYDRIGETWYIFARSDLKNYDQEIALFLDWAANLLTPCTGSCYGWTWYEGDDLPTLLTK